MKELLDLLHSAEWYGVSETIDIAKGKNEMVTNWRDAIKKIKRGWLLKK